MKLSIPKPCEQSWDGMLPIDGGRFCEACNKQVLDFTHMTDAEIVRLLKKTKGEICGRVHIQQIDRELREREWQALLPTLVLTAVLSTIIPGTSHGQSITKNASKATQIKTKHIQLQGIITDLHSGVAIPGVTIMLKEDSKIGTTSGNDGSFKIDIPITGGQDSVNLTFSSMGYDGKELAIGVDEMNQKLELAMCNKMSELKEVTVVGYSMRTMTSITGGIIAVKRRTWWQRFWDLFRRHHH
ncbi:carboxypeptidase-like regulatory domain-containing protein [Chitinophaga sp. Cy-1792]|uniref:carboxypeptidase-like regulatory domain-containing protein n=1 Tax=Chitinophaga sp. Cy-1792 TaxID=2608339 RepID=UPI0014229F2E|nr:carboxypeptidase-like regulatory domain-containing protein [Chitinophaga sp. Cy-1792]